MVQAPRALAKEYDRLGLPLRSIDANGTTTVEVVSIKVDVDLPNGALTVSPGYAWTSLENLIRDMQHETLEIH